jgi:hypothetical protein
MAAAFVMLYLIGLMRSRPLMLAELAMAGAGSLTRARASPRSLTHAASSRWSAIGVWGTAIAVRIPESAAGLPGESRQTLTKAGAAGALFDALPPGAENGGLSHVLMALTGHHRLAVRVASRPRAKF